MTIIAESERRTRYAKEILKEARIVEILLKYGKPLVIGGLAMEVFWKRDIDIVVEAKDIRESSLGALNEFIERKQFSKYQYGDFIDHPRDGRPEGYIVNLFHRDRYGEIWEFEIWFLEDIRRYERELEEWSTTVGPEDKREIIYRKAKGDIGEALLD